MGQVIHYKVGAIIIIQSGKMLQIGTILLQSRTNVSNLAHIYWLIRRSEDIFKACLKSTFKTSWRSTKCLLRSISNKS